MGGEVPVQQSSGFVEWIMANGQVVAFIAQIGYWLAMVILLGYAVWQYKRWVNFQLGTGRSGKLREGADAEAKAVAEAEDKEAPAKKPEKAVAVEDFVE